jgi:hypothetical protein
VFEKVARHVPDGAEVRQRTGSRPEDDGIIPLFDQNFRALEAKCLRQANGLAASMLEDFCGAHIYTVYLFVMTSSGENCVQFIETLGPLFAKPLMRLAGAAALAEGRVFEILGLATFTLIGVANRIRTLGELLGLVTEWAPPLDEHASK